MHSSADGLRIDNIHVWRGERHVLRDISLVVDAGELLHVSGPNGTGKTTLLRVATGLLRPELGTVSWRGRPIVSEPGLFQQQMAYASHEPALKGDLSALENLYYLVRLRRRTGASELLDSLKRTGVAGCADLPARVLSAGQRRRVALARVLALQADLWLLDEPFTNLDAAGSELLRELLLHHVGQGGLAVVVAHHALDVGAATRRLELPE